MLVTACSDNDKHESQTLRVLQDNGVFVISGGDIQSLTKGIITYYDYATQAPATLGSFVTAGGSLVDRYDCDVVAYGTKAYVLASVENTVYVYDAKSGQMLTSLSTTAMMGEGSGLGPRRITAATGKIYVSTQGGYVAAIDTASYQLIHTYQAGSRPEGISVAGNYLYVANGDDG
jgi:DNA-binding beta-propeller fold protein YncE